jgi:hypothetical protein
VAFEVEPLIEGWLTTGSVVPEPRAREGAERVGFELEVISPVLVEEPPRLGTMLSLLLANPLEWEPPEEGLPLDAELEPEPEVDPAPAEDLCM